MDGSFIFCCFQFVNEIWKDTLLESSEEQPARTVRTLVANNLVCPISMELPWDPVAAEDGRIYERSAITEHITRQRNACELKSPITNEKMGPNLLSMHQIKSLIAEAIENSEIEEELAVEWKRKQEQQQKLDELLSDAQKGDPQAMRSVAEVYLFGKFGVSINESLAEEWYKKAADAGDIPAIAHYAAVYESNDCNRAALLTVAAEGGSNCACLKLGLWMANGSHGFEVNKAHAMRWLRKGLNNRACKWDQAAEHFKKECRMKLAELEAAEQELPETEYSV